MINEAMTVILGLLPNYSESFDDFDVVNLKLRSLISGTYVLSAFLNNQTKDIAKIRFFVAQQSISHQRLLVISSNSLTSLMLFALSFTELQLPKEN